MAASPRRNDSKSSQEIAGMEFLGMIKILTAMSSCVCIRCGQALIKLSWNQTDLSLFVFVDFYGRQVDPGMWTKRFPFDCCFWSEEGGQDGRVGRGASQEQVSTENGRESQRPGTATEHGVGIIQ